VTVGAEKRRHESSVEGRGVAAWFAWPLWASSVALVALTVLLDRAPPTVSQMDEPAWADVLLAMVVLTYTTVGAFVASRRPRNPIGWIFCGTGLLIEVGLFFRAYADYVVFAGAGRSALAEYMAWLSAQLAGPVVALATLLLMLLFPTGRVPSGLLLPKRSEQSRSWWQAVVWMAVIGSTVTALWLASEPNPDGVGAPASNPLGIDGTLGDVLNSIGLVCIALLPISFLFAGASLISRLALANEQERQQLKWFAYAAAMLVGGLLVGVFLGSVSSVLWEVGIVIAILGFMFFAVATAIAILRYHLYDIDRIINRTLVYGSLTLMLALVYFGGVTLTQALLRTLTGQQELPQLVVVASTLVIAALFTPLRRRIQSFIDRRFYRRKYDARKTLESFSVKLRDETDLDSLNNELLGVVRATMAPAHVSVWLRPLSDTGRRRGSSG
jgi:hypothetical protein